MTIARPYWIDPALADPAIRYTWDDWKVATIYEPGDDALIKRLSALSRRAQTGMTIAIGEWIVFRFDSIDPDPDPKYYIEAAWAGNINPDFCPYVELEDADWAGPIRRPLQLVVALINDAFYFEGVNPAENVAWMYQLAEHVLPRTDTLHTWRDAVLSRLERHFPAPIEDENDLEYDWESSEPLVPREWFDPAYAITPALTDTLIKQYLEHIDYEENPFVLSAEDLEEVEEDEE